MNIHDSITDEADSMKRIATLLTGALIALIAMPSVLLAAPRNNAQPNGGRAQRIVQYLNLTPQQQSQLRPIMRGERQQLQAVKGDPSLTPEQRRERLKEIRQQTKGQVGQILTPDQQERLRQLRQWQRQQQNPSQGQTQQTPPQPSQP